MYFDWNALKLKCMDLGFVLSYLAVGCSLKGFSTNTGFLSLFTVRKEYLLDDSLVFRLFYSSPV